MKQNKNNQAGFTIIEMLTVMFVFAVVSAIAGAILVTSLRTSTKTNALANVRNNGTYVISQMTKTIRFARTLTVPYPCIYVSPTPFPIATSSMTIINADGGQITYACNGPSDTPANTITSNGASLMDTSTVGIATGKCSFTCSQSTTSDYPLIGINFSLNAVSPAGNKFQEQLASGSAIQFTTSVLMRNIDR
ncbi:MAG TPA: prepilin-type N-terminal cleavage/methylation domain-containing protein [Patescibacteria group bacterium]